MTGDIDFGAKNNTDAFIEDENGNEQRTTLVTVANGLPETSKPLNVEIQDYISRPVIAKFNRYSTVTTTAAVAVVNSYTITLTDATGFTKYVDGVSEATYLILYDQVAKAFYIGYVLNVVGNVLTLDTPFDYAYASGSIAKSTYTNMAIDGSTTPVTFGLRGISATYPFGVDFDITRIIFTCQADSACDLSTFGDIATGITRGLVFRKRNGTVENVFNVKTNGEMAGVMYDFDIQASTNPAQGQDGFTGRLTFAGQSKIGVAIRIVSGEDVEFLVQDDISSLTLLEVIAEGHIVK